jgi:thioredoxin 1
MLNLFLFRTIEIIIIGFKQKKFILSLINLITMSKFGELLDEKKPLLLVFFSEFDELSTSLHPILKDVAAAVGDKGKVIKINTEKNIKLSEALRVKVIPTLMIYKFGEMVWRQSGDQDANTLISLMKDQLN